MKSHHQEIMLYFISDTAYY